MKVLSLVICAVCTGCAPKWTETIPVMAAARVISPVPYDYAVPGDTHQWALNNLVRWANNNDIRVDLVDIENLRVFGRTGCAGRCIEINIVDKSANTQLNTLLHELSHAILRSTTGDENSEMAAEIVAMLAARQLGLDISESSLAYITSGWSNLAIRSNIQFHSAEIDYLVKILVKAARGK